MGRIVKTDKKMETTIWGLGFGGLEFGVAQGYMA